MKTRLLVKVRGLTLVMLVLLAVCVAPAMANAQEKTCSVGAKPGSKPVITDMSSDEELKFAEKSTKNANVKKIDAELLKLGYKEHNKKGYKVQTLDETGEIHDINVMTIAYENGESDQKSILLMEDEKTGITTTILAKGDATVGTRGVLECFFTVSLCIGGCVGCTGACAAEAIASDDGFWCILCMMTLCTGACGLAICTCADYCCESGNAWCCANKC